MGKTSFRWPPFEGTAINAAILLSLTLLAGCRPAPPVEVESTEPGFAVQGDQSLEVTVRGSGFTPGAEVRFLASGTEDAGGVIVSSTRVVDDGTLIGTIDVAPDATTGVFDVEVRHSGRTGKGVEVFGIASK